MHLPPPKQVRVCVCVWVRRTLLSAGLLDLGGLSVAHQSVVWLELLHSLGGVVEEGETSALATTELGAETKDGDLVLVHLVETGELLAELILRDVGARWVEDVTVIHNLSDMLFGVDIGHKLRKRADGHDHLLAAKQWVADELARAQSNLGFRHGGCVSSRLSMGERLSGERWVRSASKSRGGKPSPSVSLRNFCCGKSRRGSWPSFSFLPHLTLPSLHLCHLTPARTCTTGRR